MAVNDSWRVILRKYLESNRLDRFGDTWGGSYEGIRQLRLKAPGKQGTIYAHKQYETELGDPYKDADLERDQELEDWFNNVGRSMYEYQHRETYDPDNWGQWEMPEPPKDKPWAKDFLDTKLGKYVKMGLKGAGYFNSIAGATSFFVGQYSNFKSRAQAGTMDPNSRNFVDPGAYARAGEYSALLDPSTYSINNNVTVPFRPGGEVVLAPGAENQLNAEQLEYLRKVYGNFGMSNAQAQTIINRNRAQTRESTDRSITGGGKFGYATRIKPRPAGGGPDFKDEVKPTEDDE